MSDVIYNASVYSRTVSYRNFKGEEQSVELYFALDPIQLLQFIAGFTPKKSKSKNPAKQGQIEPVSEAEQIKMVRDLAQLSAGFPSDDGESWEPFEDFNNSLAGKAFMTKLTSSDTDRSEFSEKVILDPFRAFVEYAKADPSNTPKDVQNLQNMLAQVEQVFSGPSTDETLDERRARLEAELASMNDRPEQGDGGPQ